LFAALQTAHADEVKAQAEVTRLSAELTAQGREERPHSHLAKARRQLESAHKRQGRAGRGLRSNAGRLAKLEAELMGRQTQHAHLADWLAELEGDNATRLNPLTLVLRVDAGFSTDNNLTWLIEMGYVVYTKVHNGKTTDKLRRHLAATPAWQRVGRNAEAVYLPHQAGAECPYALEALLVRYHRPSACSCKSSLAASPPTSSGGLGRVILLDEQGPFAGSMFLLAGQVAFQHVLPLFSRSSFRSHATT